MITQAAIVILGGAAVALVNCASAEVRWWGAVCGLLSQPFWLYAAYRARQWGIFALSLWYSAAWAVGVAGGAG